MGMPYLMIITSNENKSKFCFSFRKYWPTFSLSGWYFKLTKHRLYRLDPHLSQIIMQPAVATHEAPLLSLIAYWMAECW